MNLNYYLPLDYLIKLLLLSQHY